MLVLGQAAHGQHAHSLTNRLSSRSFPNEPEDLWHIWLSTATATNAWATTLRQQEGWPLVVDAPPDKTLTQAQQGLKAAQVKLGYAYFAGEGVQKDYTNGIKWLREAQTFAPAQFLLGAATLRGFGVDQDFAAGVDWLNKAADQGFAEAQFQLGLCYLDGGPGVNEAPARGAKWLEHAAEQGHARAQQCLGECYAVGLGVSEDDVASAKWYRSAADQGLAAAQDFLGVCYLAGSGVEKSPSEAIKWFQKAAAQDLGFAQCNLARCYQAGVGVDKDLVEAAKCWRKAADQEFPGAAFHLGLCYYHGDGVRKDPEEAIKWFERDAKLNHVGAQLYLGLCYYLDDGVRKDESRARRYWREAGIRGIHPEHYVGGDGSAGDALEVESWWRDVAQRGDPPLQGCVAEFYHYGRGVAQDEAEALRWYRKAANGGDRVVLRAAAWLLATSDDSKVRDGKVAVTFAEKADDAAAHKDPRILDTLAAAYAEAGQFEKAATAEKSAIGASKADDERDEFRARLKLYENKTPYHASRPPVGGILP